MLTPLHGNKIDKWNIIAFDTEDDSCGNVKSVCFAFRRNGKIHHAYFESVEPAIKWIYSWSIKCVFVAHNLEYDLINLFRDKDYSDVKRMTYTARLIMANIKNSPHLFVDSMNYAAMSLKDLGKKVGLEKLEFDINNPDYVKRDAEIVLVFMERFQELVNTKLNISMYPTIGKMAVQAFRKNFLDRDYVPYNGDICVSGYYGGRCELYHKGYLEGEIKYVDFNSMYPNAMEKNLYPDTDLVEPITSIDVEFGFSEVTIYIPESLFVGPLPYRGERLIYPTGTIRGTWYNAEIRNALTRGCKILAYHDGFGTNVGVAPFKQFVNTYYGYRISNNDTFETLFWKLLLNNSYGKYFQHNDYTECRDGEMTLKEQNKTQGKLTRVLGNLYFYDMPMLEPPQTANYMWGAGITANARIEFEKLATSIHNSGNTLLYGDTDSNIYLKTQPDDFLDLDEKRLGALKLETYVSADFVMAKGYILKTEDGQYKTTCKGVPLDKSLTGEQMGTDLNRQVRFLKGEKVVFDKPLKFKESLVRNKKANVWTETPKQMREVYSRRVVLGDGPTYPHCIGSDQN